LIKKYRRALELFNEMTNDLPEKRPDCEEILYRQNLWALKEIEIENELRNIVKSGVMSKDIYIYSILESKLEEYFRTNALKNQDLGLDLDFKKRLKENFQSLNEAKSMNSCEENEVLFLQSLYHLIVYSEKNFETNIDLIDLLINQMKNYSKNILIQKAGMECLQNIIEYKLLNRIELKTLEKVVEVMLKAMESFPNQQQIQTFALQILSKDLILEDVSFDRYRCMRLTVNSLIGFDDNDMKKMGIYVCLGISRNLSTDDKTELCLKTDLMGILLGTVRQRAEYVPYNDFLFKNSLTTISDLTESSPEICKLFIEKDGLELFFLILIVK
jgi:hypothetical protein